jgi:hypothetical protein
VFNALYYNDTLPQCCDEQATYVTRISPMGGAVTIIYTPICMYSLIEKSKGHEHLSGTAIYLCVYKLISYFTLKTYPYNTCFTRMHVS